jgi:serine O-acetyltransferase
MPEMRLQDLLRADARANDVTSVRRLVGAIVGIKPYLLVVLYRISNVLARRRVPALPDLLRAIGLVVWGAEIWPTATIGPGLVIAHPAGIVIGSDVVAGSDLMIFSGVVVGASARFDPIRRSNQPVLGDRVILTAHSVVAGGIRIGDDVVVGANAVVLVDIPDRHRVRPTTPLVDERPRRTVHAHDPITSDD